MREMKFLIGILAFGCAACAQTAINVKQIKCATSSQPQIVLVMPNTNTATCVKLDTTSPNSFLLDTPNNTLRITVSVASVLFSDGETPAGVVDGINNTFSLAFAPNPALSLDLARNGLHLKAGVDYTLAGGIITFLAGAMPSTGDILLATYRH